MRNIGRPIEVLPASRTLGCGENGGLRRQRPLSGGYLMGLSARVLAVLFLVLLQLPVSRAQAPTASQGGSYGAETRVAIERIIQANDQIISGKAADAQNLLRGIAEPLKRLEALAQRFREVANREDVRCQQRIGDLERKTNDLYQQEKELNTKIDDLNGLLEAAATKRSLAEAEVTRLSASMNAAQRSIQERQEKLRELTNWWWVPGYGQYLAVRTLVDDDIGQHQRAMSALGDQQKQIQQHSASMHAAQALVADLDRQRTNAAELHGQLNVMRSSSQDELKKLKATAVFLTGADVFWGKAQTLLQVDAQGLTGTMSILMDVLKSEVQAPSSSDPLHEVARDFRQKLMEFAESVDANDNFLLKDATAYCGGPPAAKDATISAKCNIVQFTKYYKIVDPKTCAFQYLNPPGCPPAPRVVDVTPERVAEGTKRGTWTTTGEQNWVGRARCAPAAIYYGKLSNAGECEKKCRADRDCTVWTYNERNGYMGMDSITECWGGLPVLNAAKTNWSGFVSGGMR
jgi:hypothetical protein